MRRQLFLGSSFAFLLLLGCIGDETRRLKTPAHVGMNTNNIIDAVSQKDADDLGDQREGFAIAERIRRKPTAEQLARRKSVLCLSGGGSYGAFTAGVVCGWTQHGDRPGTNGRPNFDVVTGISTGALIAPLVFLGPDYDDDVKKFYTTVHRRDIFRLQPFRALFDSSVADNAPLAKMIVDVVSEDMVCKIAEEHKKGRRLYIGTTELEGNRFVCWDIGEIASRKCPGDRELIHKILLGSIAIPGFFPPSKIPIRIDGKEYVEYHGDGGVSQSIFFRPPYLPPEQRTEIDRDIAGTDLYMILAGKLYADAQPQKPRTLALAGNSVSGVLFAQARGDLQRLYLISMITGMNYQLCSMPADFNAPNSSATFEQQSMIDMFNEGFRIGCSGSTWRKSPPGVEAGESMLKRSGTDLTYQVRGPGLVIPRRGAPINPLAPGRYPLPVFPESLVK